eukprot:6161459-Amphidinium_carterae.1
MAIQIRVGPFLSGTPAGVLLWTVRYLSRGCARELATRVSRHAEPPLSVNHSHESSSDSDLESPGPRFPDTPMSPCLMFGNYFGRSSVGTVCLMPQLDSTAPNLEHVASVQYFGVLGSGIAKNQPPDNLLVV